MKTRNHPKSANAGDKPHLGFEATLSSATDQSRRIEGNLGQEPADSFHRDFHKDLEADLILLNPPFNMSDRGGDRLRQRARWKLGVPPAGNANYSWLHYFTCHFVPTGMAGFVLANRSMPANQFGKAEGVLNAFLGKLRP